MSNKRIQYSVILPVYNEEESLEELAERLVKVFAALMDEYEIIFIDDGSQDRSLEVIKKLSKQNDRIKCISFRLNSGKSTAFACGFKYSEGEIIFTMDSDLQDQPEDIPLFLEKISEGYDLVSGWKKKRNDPASKVFASRIFNFFVRKLTGTRIHDFNCGFKAYKRQVLMSLDLYGDLFRFIPALVNWRGFKVGEVEIHHISRPYGVSKYGPRRMVRGFFDLISISFIFRYLRKPLHFFGIVGSFIFIIGFIINLHLSVLWFQGEKIGSRPLLILGTLLLIIGLQFITTGLLGEMIAHFQAKKDKDDFPINEIFGRFKN